MEKYEWTKKPIRESGVSKYVGFNPVDKLSISEYFKENFKNQGREDIFFGKFERGKTEDEKKMIVDILAKMSTFIEKYGGKPLNITPEHIHILDKEKIDEEEKERLEKSKTGAVYLATKELIILFDSKDNLKNALHIVHELIHFNSFQSVQLTDAEEKEFDVRRIGFEIHTKSGDVLFKDINEAITVELAKRFDAEYFAFMEAISDDVKLRNDIRKNANGKADDISIITKNETNKDGKTKFILEYYTYKEERKKLQEIIDQIYDKNYEEFNSKEEVFAVFAEASLSGKLLKIARLIEKTYGEGSFKRLGEATKKK